MPLAESLGAVSPVHSPSEPIGVHPVPFEDELLDRTYVSRWLGLDYDTLGQWARQGKGPRVTRLSGRAIKYLRRDVLAWLEERRQAGQSAFRRHPGREPDRRQAEPITPPSSGPKNPRRARNR